ncbi:D-ribose pyranase [Cohaesibacter sp. CAU 1516]|uniref:D-ribose pyranase n=1 Tax=Cohaesibacter sp. CAU 1516 TaxID=2576038 RepID=UPI0010FE841F|nr:D-ribose pyranase [Cohaesibacter sp. CAU 1516]TLP46164.1 D-ribose pyranase [Cohaesibacter sp. CAU 1516]
MRKAVLLNSDITRVVSEMGHGNALCIGDAGLPVPDGVERIDLAVSRGLPSFMDTLSAVTAELFVERVLIATEMVDQQPGFHKQVVEWIEKLALTQGNQIEIQTVAHESFKVETETARAVVRTGECTPYANIILYSGVSF